MTENEKLIVELDACKGRCGKVRVPWQLASAIREALQRADKSPKIAPPDADVRGWMLKELAAAFVHNGWSEATHCLATKACEKAAETIAAAWPKPMTREEIERAVFDAAESSVRFHHPPVADGIHIRNSYWRIVGHLYAVVDALVGKISSPTRDERIAELECDVARLQEALNQRISDCLTLQGIIDKGRQALGGSHE